MRGKNPVVPAAAILFVVSIVGASVAAFPTEAQRMAPAAGTRLSTHARPVAPHVVSTRASAGSRTAPAARNRIHFNSASNSFEASDGSPVSLQDLLNPIPPPGFDYQFLSVMNQDLAIKAVIDPATEWKLAIAERLMRNRSRFGGSGFYLLDGGGAYAVPDDSASVDSTPPQQTDQPAQQPRPSSCRQRRLRSKPPSSPLPMIRRPCPT